MRTEFAYGPTFAEMRDPSRIEVEVRKQALEKKRKDPLHPLNLFNITWKQDDLSIPHVVLPRELTNGDANIVVLIARHFPTGAQGRPGVQLPDRKTGGGRVAAGARPARVPVDGQLRHRRRVGRTADELRVVGSVACRDERGAI